LRATLEDKDGTVVRLDSASYVDFALTKVEVPKDPLKQFDANNTQVLFDSSNPKLS